VRGFVVICGVQVDRSLSEIFRLEASALGNPGKHARTDFLSIVEGKNVIGPFRPG